MQLRVLSIIKAKAKKEGCPEASKGKRKLLLPKQKAISSLFIPL